MDFDRDGRAPYPKALGLCSLGTRLVATHRGDRWYWRHYTECKCPEYQPWETSFASQADYLRQLAEVKFVDAAEAEEFRTAALEFLTGIKRVPEAYSAFEQAVKVEVSRRLEDDTLVQAYQEQLRRDGEALRLRYDALQSEKAKLAKLEDEVARLAKVLEHWRQRAVVAEDNVAKANKEWLAQNVRRS